MKIQFRKEYVTPFKHLEFGTVRVVEQEGEHWFVLKDVCDALGLSNPSRVANRLDEDEKAKSDPNLELGSRSNEPILIINESGLYNVIIRSDKPQAKTFKRWITHEVLPTIRRHGAYVTPSKVEDLLKDPSAWIKLLTALQDERNRAFDLKAKVDEMQPKALFADAVASSSTTILIGELAKILKANGVDTGQTRLFEFMRSNGYLIRRKGTDRNMPTQKGMELGLFYIKESAHAHADGHVTIKKTTKVTGKGQTYFINLFLKQATSVGVGK